MKLFNCTCVFIRSWSCATLSLTNTLHGQVPTCTGDLSCNNLVLMSNRLEWLNYNQGNRHSRQVQCRVHTRLRPYRSKDNRQGPQHLLPCPTSCMGILVTRHLERLHTLSGLNCLLLCQFPWDNHHCCSHRKPSPTSALEATLPTSSSSNNKASRQAHSPHLDKLKTSLEHPLNPLHHHLRSKVKRQMHKQGTLLMVIDLTSMSTYPK